MGFYIAKGKIYMDSPEGGFQNIGVKAVDKVITVREIESIEVIPGKHTVSSLDQPELTTLDEIVRRFNVSEANPILTSDETEQAEILGMEYNDLKSYAAKRGVDVYTYRKREEIVEQLLKLS